MSTESKSDFPAPPAFYKLYAPGTEGPPPPAPVVGSYTYFGTTDETVERDFVPKLPDKERIYTLRSDTLNEIKGQLRLLNRELIFGFAELLAAIADRPSQYARGLERILKLQINIQDLINQVRPHQARSTLQYTLQQQVEEKRKGIAKLRAQQEQCVELLSAVAGQLEASVAAAGTDKAEGACVGAEATEAGATAMDVER